MTDYISLDRMEAIQDLLEKHYRLGAMYFASDYNKETGQFELDFPCTYDELKECIIKKGVLHQSGEEQITSLADNQQFVDALWVMMSVCQLPERDDSIPATFKEYWQKQTAGIEGDDSDEYQDMMNDLLNESIETFFEKRLQKDLLKLYIYHKEKPKDIPTELTIRYGKGKSIKLENSYNWFENVLLAEHFKKFLPDIKSVDDAKKALNRIDHATDKLSRPLMYHFIYGTYSMIADMTGHTKTTDAMCYLLINLMEEMDYPTEYLYKGEPVRMDIPYIRTMISRLKKDPKRAQFNLEIPLKFSEIEDVLRKTGRCLYARTNLYNAAIDDIAVRVSNEKSENVTR